MRNPYTDIVRPTIDEAPTLHGGGLFIVFGSDDQPVLPRFKPASAGEVRKISWFAMGDDGQWWILGDDGCSDEWLAQHPGYGDGPAERHEDGPVDRPQRVITWTANGEVLRDVTIAPRAKNTRTDIQNWIGDFTGDITDEQLDALVDAANTIDARWPAPDDADSRERALFAASQVILGDRTLAAIGDEWREARRVERQRMAALTGALIATPGSERELVEQSGVARMTVRKALGR